MTSVAVKINKKKAALELDSYLDQFNSCTNLNEYLICLKQLTKLLIPYEGCYIKLTGQWAYKCNQEYDLQVNLIRIMLAGPKSIGTIIGFTDWSKDQLDIRLSDKEEPAINLIFRKHWPELEASLFKTELASIHSTQLYINDQPVGKDVFNSYSGVHVRSWIELERSFNPRN